MSPIRTILWRLFRPAPPERLQHYAVPVEHSPDGRTVYINWFEYMGPGGWMDW